MQPTGLTVTGFSTRWTRSGSPWRENGLSVRESTLSLSSRPGGGTLFNSDSGTSWATGSQGAAYVKGWWSSNEFAGPTILTPQWSYKGTAQIKSVTVTGVGTDGWTTAETVKTVDSTAVCSGPSVALTYVRAKQAG